MLSIKISPQFSTLNCCNTYFFYYDVNVLTIFLNVQNCTNNAVVFNYIYYLKYLPVAVTVSLLSSLFFMLSRPNFMIKTFEVDKLLLSYVLHNGVCK